MSEPTFRSPEPAFDATYVSYSRKDVEFARRLAAALETYRPPKTLVRLARSRLTRSLGREECVRFLRLEECPGDGRLRSQ